MTRFLPGGMDNAPSGLNWETERLFAYHQATKHTYDSVRSGAHYLDWKNQPNPFRTYDGAPTIALPPEPGFPQTGCFATMAGLAAVAAESTESTPCANGQQESPNRLKLDQDWISRLLWHSMAVSAWKKVPQTGSRYSLRVNPSSGNLHPTETYIALCGVTGLGDGLYHYRADRHALELRSSGAWTFELSQALMAPWASESSLIIVLTSIFWREAWKYRDRAYRYCCHDLGHAMMSLLIAARAMGLTGEVISHFGDCRLARTLGLTGSDEAPMAVLVFATRDSPDPARAFSGVMPATPFAGIPNELSPDEVPYELLLGIHLSTLLPDSDFSRPLPSSEAAVIPLQTAAHSLEDHQPFFRGTVMPPVPDADPPLGAVARSRRSALDFDARTAPMPRQQLEQLLDFATRGWRADWRGNLWTQAPQSPGTNFVALYLYVHRVRDCNPGVYRWHPRDRTLEQLHRGNVERVASYLSLEQSLAGNACFAVSMIADLAAASRAFGNRGYRYVYFEAGAIGQRLYLGAQALDWNATGIGAFYDDDVHRYLGFLEEGDEPVSASVDTAEQAALVMLGSPASRLGAPQKPRNMMPVQENTRATTSEAADTDAIPFEATHAVPASESGTGLRADSVTLPRQVIYHFAVGRAVPDPRIEA